MSRILLYGSILLMAATLAPTPSVSEEGVPGKGSMPAVELNHPTPDTRPVAGSDEPDSGGGVCLDAFRRIPVLQNGRKMPLDSFARHKLLQFSGRRRLAGEPAASWLARVFFAPHTVADDALFLIENPETAEALGIEAKGRSRYSVAALDGALSDLESMARRIADKEEDARTSVENELLRLYVNVLDFMDLAHAFSFAHVGEPFSVVQPELKRLLGLPGERHAFSFFEIFRRARNLQPVVSHARDMPQDQWGLLEQEALYLAMNLYEWTQHYQDIQFVMIPLHEEGVEQWRSSWNVIAERADDPHAMVLLDELQELAHGYVHGDPDRFDQAARTFTRLIQERLPDDRDLQWTDLEVVLNDLNPFFWSKLLYVLAFLTALGAIITHPDAPRRAGLSRFFLMAAAALCVLALIPHLGGLILRVLIMGRPPATNLYSTFIFVAFASAVLGLVVEAFYRNSLGVLTGSFCGVALLLVANYFALDGDTMGKIAAVLSSNFWLSTHVLTITLGYAGCVLAGLIGHVHLAATVIAPHKRDLLSSLQRALYGVLAFGLVFTWLGTMLGGVWADQSWGRFWGWDPKENGALLIVLWCTVLFHARLANMIRDIGMAAGAAIGIVFVMFAWLGVNLLGVGLHSYGFTSGLATGLIAYMVIQILLLAILVPAAKRRSRTRITLA